MKELLSELNLHRPALTIDQRSPPTCYALTQLGASNADFLVIGLIFLFILIICLNLFKFSEPIYRAPRKEEFECAEI